MISFSSYSRVIWDTTLQTIPGKLKRLVEFEIQKNCPTLYTRSMTGIELYNVRVESFGQTNSYSFVFKNTWRDYNIQIEAESEGVVNMSYIITSFNDIVPCN